MMFLLHEGTYTVSVAPDPQLAGKAHRNVKCAPKSYVSHLCKNLDTSMTMRSAEQHIRPHLPKAPCALQVQWYPGVYLVSPHCSSCSIQEAALLINQIVVHAKVHVPAADWHGLHRRLCHYDVLSNNPLYSLSTMAG